LPKAQLPWAIWESALCCTWAENVSNISNALLLVSQRGRMRQCDNCWTLKPKCKDYSEVKHPVFEVSGLPPCPPGFEVEVRFAFVLRDAVRNSIVVLILEPPFQSYLENFFRDTQAWTHLSYLLPYNKLPQNLVDCMLFIIIAHSL
jgi:hypothetical protein